MSAQLGEMVEVAAQLGALGLDPMKFLYTRDETERDFMVALGKKIFEIRQMLDHNLAVDIANNVGKLFK